MADVTVFHNPRCSTSRAALETAASAGVPVDVVQYLKTPLDESALLALMDKLEDEPAALVRTGGLADLGLTPDELATREDIARVLAAHPALMQRPVLLRGDRAIIGRPKDRVEPFLRG